MLTIIIIVVAFIVKRHKSRALIEQPFYDYVAPPQLPARPQRIEMEGNEAYGLAQTGTPGPQLPAQPERIEMEGNEAYGLAETGSPEPLKNETPVTAPQVQPNVAYGVISAP